MKNLLLRLVPVLLLAAHCAAQDWSQVSPPITPGPRYGQAMAYDSAHHQIVMFGGRLSSGQIVGDTWVFNHANWEQRFPQTSPGARGAHDMVYDAGRGQVLLFGGTDSGGGQLNDTWIWDGHNWTQKFPAHVPSPKQNAQFLVYDAAHEQILMFGGAPSGSNDTWVWNGNDWIQKYPDTVPPPRVSHAMAFDAAHNQVVLFGGNPDGSNALSDTWTWDGNNWTEVFPSSMPPARWNAVMSYDPVQDKVLLFGGCGPLGIPTYGDTWIWDGSNWTEFISANPPAPRIAESSFATDLKFGEIVLFGGAPFSGPFFGDTWVWSLP